MQYRYEIGVLSLQHVILVYFLILYPHTTNTDFHITLTAFRFAEVIGEPLSHNHLFLFFAA